MTNKRFDRIKRCLKGRLWSRVGIIITAALLLVLISIVQYYSMRNILRDGVAQRVKTELGFKARMIANTLDRAEFTMQEHLWDMQEHLKDPDAMFEVTRRLIAANSQIVGGCIAFVPNYYREKGRLFEPYATKSGGQITVTQLGSADHDYTQHPAFIAALKERCALWSDPYEYVGDSVTRLVTYTYPLIDEKGEVAAVCGLDINLSWLSDTLNARHFYPSSFGMMFTKDGQLVVEPADYHDGKHNLEYIIKLVSDSLAARKMTPQERSRSADFKDRNNGNKACVYYTTLQKSPHWVLATVNYYDEVYKPVRRNRLLNMILMLTGLLVLFFIVNRFARNERKLQAASAEKARIGSELMIANGIQQAMLPKTFPPFPERQDVDIYGSQVPAKEVGGDLFDFFIRDEKLFFCIGDVSGKGVPSAIVMAMVQKLFRVASSHENNPVNIVQSINEELGRDNTTNMFITFFMGILDLPTGRLRYCNAGHDNPFIIQRGEQESLIKLPMKTNLPIGVFVDYDYVGEEFQLTDEAMLFLYTDGLTEAKDAQRQQFKFQRVEEILSVCAQQPAISAKEMLLKITDAVNHFVGDAEQSDDLTMLAISYKRPIDDVITTRSITLSNDITQVAQLNNFVKEFATEVGIPQKEIRKLQLAIEEVVVNVMSYAYPTGMEGEVNIEESWNGQCIKYTISDYGVAFDPTLSVNNVDITLSAEERPIGGLGILLTRRLVDSINYERIDGRNVLTVRKAIHG